MLLLQRKLERCVEEEEYESAEQIKQQLDREALNAKDDGSALSLVKTIRQLSAGGPHERLDAARRIAETERVDKRAENVLLHALHDEDEIATLAEQGLLRMWEQNDDSATAEQYLAAGSRLLQSHRVEEAMSKFDDAIVYSPGWAEARNKRATCLYLLASQQARTGASVPQQTLDDCMRECEMVLELNANHFGALSGLGLARLLADEKDDALKAFSSALAVNPRLKIKRLKSRVERELGYGE